MLKADFHTHSLENKEEYIFYNAKELVDNASKSGYDVISITQHNQVYYDNEIKRYAEKKGILLIPGVEATVEGKHILILNITQEQLGKIKTFEDLEKLKKKHNIIVAASHPFFIGSYSLKNKLLERINVFDAIEHAHLYCRLWNRENKLADVVAKRFNKPMIANSDCHHLWQMGSNYTLVDGKKDIKSVLDAIRKGRIKVVSKPLPLYKFIAVLLWLILDI